MRALQKKNSESLESSKEEICPLCRGTGMVLSKKEGIYTSYKPCKCAEMDKVNIQWKKSGLNINDMDKSFKNFEPWNNEIKDLKDKATGYYLSFEKIKSDRTNSILLCGNPGCGKTHLSLALANNFLKKGKQVLYMPFLQANLDIKQNITDQVQYQKLMTKYKDAEILLIDDLLKGKSTEYDKNILFEIINHRYINNKPMIISTEKTVSELLEFDQAIGSRIYEMCKNYNICIKGIENNYRTRGVK